MNTTNEVTITDATITVIPKPITPSNDETTLIQNITEKHGQIQAGLRTTLEQAREAGTYLQALKQIVKKKGYNWTDYVKNHLPLSYVTANNYMLVAKHWTNIFHHGDENQFTINLSQFLKAIPKKKVKKKVVKFTASQGSILLNAQQDASLKKLLKSIGIRTTTDKVAKLLKAIHYDLSKLPVK